MRCSCPLCRVGTDHTWLFLALCGVAAACVVGWVCIQVGKPVLTTVGGVVGVAVCTGVVRAFTSAVRATPRGSVSGIPETAGEGRGPVQGGTVRESRDPSLDLPSPVDELAVRRAQKERAA